MPGICWPGQRDEKARLASPGGHPYRGWRQWPDDFGRLELERYNVAAASTPPEDAKAAVSRASTSACTRTRTCGRPTDPRLREVAFGYMDAARRLAERMLGLYARSEGVRADTFTLDRSRT